ncbi:unnamed protein product [Bursaphelenchus okinawaensis]|uniref:Uncharacterized protein n=1 Tax=Bursaphelenchus okinawaensis TaxID=465554 RepID=A0A811LSL5_9BILA|nr:unnamed protein product [Bursaphelenchus okinawaensis]CAG9127720.1 unnamed protein product [Bursaphelenchus okinawaensis]
MVGPRGHAKYALTNFAVIHGKHVYVLKKVRYAKKQQNKKNYILGIEYSHKKNGVVLCIEAKMEYKKNSARPTTSFKACATEGEVYG